MAPDFPPPLPQASFSPASPYLPFGNSYRILVVDDELCIRQVLSALLRDENHQVEVAANGFDALQSFRRSAPDIVLTDRAMPGMDGEQLAREIKKLSPDTPVILVTGLAPRPYNERVIDAMVPKPFTRASLCQVMSAALISRAGKQVAA